LLHPESSVEPNDTVLKAENLGNLSSTPRLEVIGTIGNGPAGARDVDWYSFTLTSPTTVSVRTLDHGVSNALTAVVSLYNTDPFDSGDPYDPTGYRLLAQGVGTAQADASVTQALAAGTYYVAVSGSGNRYFHPLMTGSGYPGTTGNYGLLVTGQSIPIDPSGGPIVLGSDPGPTVLASSPLILRVELSSALDPSTIALGQNVNLLLNPTGTFGNGNDQNVPLAGFNLSTAGNELQVTPAAPFQPGFYELVVCGTNSSGVPGVADLQGNYLGQDATHPQGQDWTLEFQVNAVEGQPNGPDDVPAGAHELGDVTQAGLVQTPGVIGDDPNAPVLGADVDLYHFRISGPGQYALTSEVFAGRIGSPLDPGLSLFILSPVDGQLHLLAGNDSSLNPTATDDGSMLPLGNDPVLFAGLQAGDYYLAVSSTGNVPIPVTSQLPGTNGIFDPNQPNSSQAGWSTGPYILNLYVHQDLVAPRVVSVTPGAGTTLSGPPTQIQVQFSKPVNVEQLAFQAFQATGQGALAAVFILGAGGTIYSPRLVSFDSNTDQATFLLLDPLPSGTYALHLSGANGLTDFAGNLLVGNDPSGDYIVPFTVQAPARGTGGNPLLYTFQGAPTGSVHDQSLGTLFPNELAQGVTIERAAPSSPGIGSTELKDYYRFTVLQSAPYLIGLQAAPSALTGLQMLVVDAKGLPVPGNLVAGSSGTFQVTLQAGQTYGIELTGWNPSQAANVSYQVQLCLGTSPDVQLPLTAGPAPVIRLQLVSSVPTPPGGQPPQVSGPTLAASSPTEGSATTITPTGSSVGSPSGTIILTGLTVGAGSPPAPALASLTREAVASSSVTLPMVSAPAHGASSTGGSSASSLLTALSVGPVRGTRDATPNEPAAVSDRVAVRGPDPHFVESLLQTTILTQTSGTNETTVTASETDEGPSLRFLSAITRLLDDTVKETVTSWQDTVDRFFDTKAWMGGSPLLNRATENLQEEDADEPPTAAKGPRAMATPTVRRKEYPTASDEPAVGPSALPLIVAGAALVIPRRVRSRRTPTPGLTTTRTGGEA
jgi:hypothetical protein